VLNYPTIALWGDILTVSAVLFGGGVIAVMLYTYLHDYAARSNALRRSVFPKRKGR
jgi:hypothetical protein